MIKRQIQSSFKKMLGKYPILALTGPRQSGKTTFLREVMNDYRYVSLEDPDIREYATSDPRAFLAEYDQKVIFDEVQRAPELFSYLQTRVDQSKIMGQYIMSGSQNFNLMQNISQSLAGRVAIFKMLPFDFVEMRKANILSQDLSTVFSTGFYPAIFDRNIDPNQYYSDYITTYINRDVSQLLNIQNQRVFRLFIKLCADRASQLVNYNDLARDAGVSHTTVRNWLSVLETSYIVFFVQPYFNNFSKRLVKSPKLYFHDTGLLTHLLDYKLGQLKPNNSKWGAVFENMVVGEFIKQNAHQNQLQDFWFWRDSNGNEVDLLTRKNNELNAIEIKASQTINRRQFKELEKFISVAALEEKINPTLVYGGLKGQTRNHIKIRSWQSINKN